MRIDRRNAVSLTAFGMAVMANRSVQYGWMWLLFLLLTDREACLQDVAAALGSDISANDEAVARIEDILFWIRFLFNSSNDIHSSESDSHNNWHKQNLTVNMKSLHIMKKLSRLCEILNPHEEQNELPDHYNYMPILTNHAVDHFGCRNLWTYLATGLTANRSTTTLFGYTELKLQHWLRKFQKTEVLITSPSEAAFSEISTNPSTKHHPTFFLKIPEDETTKPPAVHWNKGLTRYDTSWIKTDMKMSDKEIVYYDTFDPSKKEDARINIGKSAVRILPAFTVVLFLIFCWYFFVYRRMKQRQQRARALLNQYQAILSGSRALSGSVMIISNSSGTADNNIRLFHCSSSTYDSCLNDNCNSEDNAQNASATTVPNSENIASRPTPARRPPMYDEIYPPAYESIYGTVV